MLFLPPLVWQEFCRLELLKWVRVYCSPIFVFDIWKLLQLPHGITPAATCLQTYRRDKDVSKVSNKRCLLRTAYRQKQVTDENEFVVEQWRHFNRLSCAKASVAKTKFELCFSVIRKRQEVVGKKQAEKTDWPLFEKLMNKLPRRIMVLQKTRPFILWHFHKFQFQYATERNTHCMRIVFIQPCLNFRQPFVLLQMNGYKMRSQDE